MAYYITDKCIGCGACARDCPVHAISGEIRGRHVINEKRCISCGVCGMTCPAGAVTDDSGSPCVKVPKSERSRPVIDSGVCSACRICVTYCPKGVLEICNPRFQGDIRSYGVVARPDDCIGCGMCARECPIGAIVMRGGPR